MNRFFVKKADILDNTAVITGEDVKHISKVLRMAPGDKVMLCDGEGYQYLAHIDEITKDEVTLGILSKEKCASEPSRRITLYQGLPKGDKMELIVQKCVELGISRIVPMLSARCVSRPDEKALRKKRERWQKIALQAAMQSRRGIIPEVADCVSFAQAAALTKENEQTIFFYELGGDSVKEILTGKPKTLGMFIGSEGGFEESEVRQVLANGGRAATLGKRILRAETAPLAALSIIMYQTDNF